MPEIADLYVVLRGVTSEFTASMAEAGAASESADGKITSVIATTSKMALGMTAGALAIGAASVKLASDFNTTMTQLSTLADVPKSQMASLQSGVLDLAGQVGYSPNSLAAALYHVESSFASTGISGAKALEILKVGAEGAKVGGADLTDTMNALDAMVVSGIPGVQNINDAMSALLKTVGSGDMTMQDFANAASTGIMATAKAYGASLTDVGASLAVFGDNNIRGTNAATDLRMSIMDLTKQSTTGQKALEGIGISAGQLGKDMQTGGLNKAMTDLHDHLIAAGDTGAKMGTVLEDAFTKKSSAPLAILLGQFDRLQGKYTEINGSTGGFASAWAQTTAQLGVKLAQARSEVEALAIRLGEALIPVVDKIIDGFVSLIGWFERHKAVTNDLGQALKYFAIGALPMLAVGLYGVAAAVVAATWEFVAIAAVVGAAAYGFQKLYESNGQFRAEIDKLAQAVKNGAVVAFHDLTAALRDGETWVQTHHQLFVELGNAVAALSVQVGHALVDAYHDLQPAINTVITIVRDLVSWVEQHRAGLKVLAEIVGAVVVIAFKLLGESIKNMVREFEISWDVVHGTLIVFGNLWDFFRDLGIDIAHIAEDIGSAFVTAGSAIETAWNDTLNFLENLPGTVERIFTSMVSAVVNTLKNWANAVDNALIWLVDLPKKIYDWVVAQGGLLGIGAKIMLALKAGLVTGATDVWNFFTALPGEILGFFVTAEQWLLSAGDDVVSGLWNGITAAAKNVWAWFKALPGELGSMVAGAASWLVNAGENVITGLWNGLVAMYRQAKQWFTNIPSDLAGALSGIGSWFLTIGDSIVTGIINGMGNIAQRIGDKLKAGLTGVVSSAYKFIEGGSPSKLFARTIGESISTGVGKGITDNALSVHYAMVNMLTGASKFGAQSSRVGVNIGGSVAAGAGVSNVGGGTTIINLNVPAGAVLIDTAAVWKLMQSAALSSTGGGGVRNPTVLAAFGGRG